MMEDWTFGWAALAVYLAYRAGWHRGSRRMAAALGGRVMGWARVRDWIIRKRRERAGDIELPNGMRPLTKEEFAEHVAEVMKESAAEQPAVPKGQYL